MQPTSGYFADSLGWAYFRQDNFDSAVLWLEKAIQLAPTDPVIADHLGDAYWKVGRFLEARYKWQQALDMGIEDKYATIIAEKMQMDWNSPAPAKVNLSLNITGRRADGYHDLISFAAFTSYADQLTISDDRPTGLTISGPFAAELQKNLQDNLINKTRTLSWQLGSSHNLTISILKNIFPLVAALGADQVMLPLIYAV